MSRLCSTRFIALVLALVTVVGCGGSAAPPAASAPVRPSAGQGGPAETADPAPAHEEPLVPPTETIDPYDAVELPSVDESGQDPAFAEFYQQLKETVEAKDAGQLLALVHPHIRTGFGEDGGIDAFRQQWELDKDPAHSPLWPLLSDILNLGGTFLDAERKAFFAPYVYSRFPEQLDAFSHVAITASGVKVRVEPRLDAGVVAVVDHLVVKRLQGDAALPPAEVDGRSYDWIKVGLPTGQAGYVLSRDAWSPVGYRAGFSPENGKWLMNFLVAGD